jgi:hypothetical protein
MMTPIDPKGLKAELPEGLRTAMQLDASQFEDLEVSTLQVAAQFADTAVKLGLCGEVHRMNVGFRPKENPRQQYFDIEYAIMVDKRTRRVRLDVKSFKPLDRRAYTDFCKKEFGEAPADLLDAALN